jgi:elongation factor Ts
LKEQTIAEGKPADKADMIVKGRVKKLLAENCLVDQPFVKDQSKLVSEYLKINETKIINYVRFEVGEGVEKKVVDFAKEVAEQMEHK